MAGVKTGKSGPNQPGQKTAPKRAADWVAPAKVVRCSGNPAVAGILASPVTAKLPSTDEEKSAVTAYDAACRLVGQAKPNDTGAENARGIAYQRLVRLGLRPQVRGRYRGL